MSSRSGKGTAARLKTALPPARTGGREVTTLVVSDIHLGSKVSRAGRLIDLIENEYKRDGKYLFERLVLLGDIFDGLNLERLAEADWNFLGLVQQIAEPEHGVNVVWLNGNHDFLSETVVQDFFDANVVRDYEWTDAGKKFVATHGDRFDKFVQNKKRASKFFSNLYLYIQRIDFKTQPISRFLKRMSKKIYLPKNLHEDIIAYARGKKADIIFCGHTHHADERIAPDGIAYYNSGCWTDIPSTYLTVDKEGAVKIHEVW